MKFIEQVFGYTLIKTKKLHEMKVESNQFKSFWLFWEKQSCHYRDLYKRILKKYFWNLQSQRNWMKIKDILQPNSLPMGFENSVKDKLDVEIDETWKNSKDYIEENF